MNTLTTQDKEDYINNTLLPTFRPMIKQNIYLSIFSIEGKVLFLTDKSAASLSDLPTEQNIGASYQNPSEEQINLLQQKYHIDREDTIKACNKIYELQMEIVATGQARSYIDLIPYDGKFQGYICVTSPLFHPNGEVIALLVNSTNYHLFGLHEFISLQKPTDINSLHSPELKNLKIKLSPRQHEILFLVSNGFSQSEVAQILNISRGSIAKIIASQICPKFNIANDSIQLISYARMSGIHETIPRSLWKRYIIILP